MAVIPIRLLGDPVLRVKCKRVPAADRSLQRLIDDMVETLRAAPGVGLAAPQVGVPLRVVVVESAEDELYCLINPEVVKRTGSRTVEEGCLSLPGYRALVSRAEAVVVKARDRNYKPVRIRANELLAQALEHEIDHLDGVLFVDYLKSQDELYRVDTGPQPVPQEQDVPAR